MYKYLLLILLFNNYFFYSRAQNLVPNPSFEDTISCPNGFGQIDKSSGWMSFSESPDYYNACAVSCSVMTGTCFGIPQSHYGSQEAFDGNAYVGLATYYELYQYREIIGTQLIHPLSRGIKYFVSCYISNAGGYTFFPHHYSDGSSNNFGFRFFMNSYSPFNPCPIDNFSHIHETSIITDSVNWTKISGSFIADSSYQYIAMGNFYDDQHTDTINILDSDTLFINGVYYFVDNICVSEDSLDCQLIDRVDNYKLNINVKVYPTPFNDKLTFENESDESLEIVIYDFLFRKILDQRFSHDVSLNTLLFEKGIYLYEVKNKMGIIKNGKVVKL